MDIHAIFQLIQKHPFFKTHPEAIRSHILASRQAEVIDWSELRRRFLQDFPEILTFLDSNRIEYRILATENLKRRREGYEFICYGEQLFPSGCYLMLDPPLTLAYWGHPAWLLGRSVAVVGSRDPRNETLIWMEKELSISIEQQHLHIVSGGARGVDQKSHSLAIRKNLPTTVVLPSGLGNLYPHSLNDWCQPVLDVGGCFLSEYIFDQRMHKYLFHHRNRLIAALAKVVLIAEAKKRSGTMITAQQALNLSRSVLVVPGHPQDPHFAGSLELLSEGATLVRDAQDLDIFFQSEFIAEKPINVGVGKACAVRH